MGRRRRNNNQGATGSSSGGGGGRKLLINATEPEESRIAVLKQGRLDEYYIERQSLGSTLGNIYKAKVTNVEKSIGAAFVDFGHGRQGFLHVSDLCMEAVDSDAAVLLAGVQAAREVAHDEDVVEPAPKSPGTAEQAADADPAPQAADLAADTDDEGDLASDQGDWSDGGDSDASGTSTEELDPLDVEEEGPGGTDELGGPGGDDDLDRDDAEGERVAADADDESDEDDTDRDSDDDDAESDGDGVDDDEEGDDDDGAERADDRGIPAALLALFGPLTEVAEQARVEAEALIGPSRQGRNGAARSDSTDGRGRRRRGRRAGRGNRGTPAGGNSGSSPGVSAARPARNSSGRRDVRQMPPIEQILQKGQEIVVQVIKDGIGTKGPTLTTYLSIPGRFIVLMPGIAKRGVSRKVTDPDERERLKKIVQTLEAPDDLGFVVRTAGSRCDADDLQRDLTYLLRLWEQMKSRSRGYSAPVLLYQENDLVIRTLRDLYDGQGEIVTDDEATAEKARDFLTQILPDCVDRVQLHRNEKPLFTHYGLETELNRLLQSRIELKSGGSLIIEQTEALVAIDVNSGRFKPEQHKNIDETAFLVNSEAAVEIARQIRLRDLGGVVVVDFIDMRAEKHRKQVERIFKDELRGDRARIKLARFSPFGIIELTRQRVRPSLKRSVHQRCPYCEGTGYVPSDETSCLGVIRRVRENLWRPGSVLVVTVRPEVAEAVLNTQKRILADFEAASRKQVFVRADHRLAYEDIEVRAMVALPDALDHRRA